MKSSSTAASSGAAARAKSMPLPTAKLHEMIVGLDSLPKRPIVDRARRDLGPMGTAAIRATPPLSHALRLERAPVEREHLGRFTRGSLEHRIAPFFDWMAETASRALRVAEDQSSHFDTLR